MKAIIAGVLLGLATLALASHKPAPVYSAGPIPLCPPDQPNCSLNH